MVNHVSLRFVGPLAVLHIPRHAFGLGSWGVKARGGRPHVPAQRISTRLVLTILGPGEGVGLKELKEYAGWSFRRGVGGFGLVWGGRVAGPSLSPLRAQARGSNRRQHGAGWCTGGGGVGGGGSSVSLPRPLASPGAPVPCLHVRRGLGAMSTTAPAQCGPLCGPTSGGVIGGFGLECGG